MPVFNISSTLYPTNLIYELYIMPITCTHSCYSIIKQLTGTLLTIDGEIRTSQIGGVTEKSVAVLQR